MATDDPAELASYGATRARNLSTSDLRIEAADSSRPHRARLAADELTRRGATDPS